MYQFTCTMKKAPDKCEVHRSLKNCDFSVQNLLHVTSWHLEFGDGFQISGKIVDTYYRILLLVSMANFQLDPPTHKTTYDIIKWYLNVLAVFRTYTIYWASKYSDSIMQRPKNWPF